MQSRSEQGACSGIRVTALLLAAGLWTAASVTEAQAQDIYEEGADASEEAAAGPEGRDAPPPPVEAAPAPPAGYPPFEEGAQLDDGRPALLVPIGYEEAVQEAKSRRLSGILIFGIGTGLGLATTATAFMFYLGCSAYDKHPCSDEARIAGLVGLGITAVSVAVGVPLWISGQRELGALRRQQRVVGQLQLSPLPGGAALGARWQF